MSNSNQGSPYNKTIRLADGRSLGYAEYGVSAGKALFYFHGHPGSRLEARFLADQAIQANTRLIGVDRPGMGLSSYQAGRRLLDWPDDVSELADSLGIDRFGIGGFSGGGPYAIACAFRLAHRLTSCGNIAGVGHLKPFLSFLSQWMPWLMMPMVSRFFRNDEQAQKSLVRFSQNWPEPDQKCLEMPGIKELMAASLAEGLCQGTKGAAYDGVLLGRSWGFQLQDIKFPNLYLWHGELDKEVPVATAKEMVEQLPECRATFCPNEGHISLIVNHAKEIVTGLIS